MPKGRPHYFTRRDTNQKVMASTLRELGFEVYDISALTDKQCPGDILVRGWHVGLERWLWQPFEIKTRHGRATPEQCERADSGAVPIAREVVHVLEWFCREEEAATQTENEMPWSKQCMDVLSRIRAGGLVANENE